MVFTAQPKRESQVDTLELDSLVKHFRYSNPHHVVIIPIIAFIEDGMTLPMGRITMDYLINHRLCPHQCAPNMFRILGCVDALNEHL